MIPKVKLIWHTPYGDNLIAMMARVSAQNQHDKPDKLINYLINHNHWSPFEMANMCVEIITTRSISAQLMRHRSFTFQEFSQRYAEVIGPPAMPQLRRQDKKNRQNSVDDLKPEIVNDMLQQIGQLNNETMRLYSEMLNLGIAKECARDILPMSIPTKLYMNGTVRSWLHYCDLRTNNGTQKEHMNIAEKCKTLLEANFPVTSNAFFNR